MNYTLMPLNSEIVSLVSVILASSSINDGFKLALSALFFHLQQIMEQIR